MNYKAPKQIPIVFHNGSTYDYHFTIKELAKEFKREFKCLGENTEPFITFSVPIKNDKGKKYKIKFDNSFRLCQAHYQVLLIIFLMGFIMIYVSIVSLILTLC